MKLLRTIIRGFVLGAIAGLLVAPRAGRETRELLRDRWNDLLDGATGVSFDNTASPGAADATATSSPAYPAGGTVAAAGPDTL